MQNNNQESNNQLQPERANQSTITFIPLSSAIDTFTPYNCASSLFNGLIKCLTSRGNENIGVMVQDPISRRPFIVEGRLVGQNIFYN